MQSYFSYILGYIKHFSVHETAADTRLESSNLSKIVENLTINETIAHSQFKVLLLSVCREQQLKLVVIQEEKKGLWKL